MYTLCDIAQEGGKIFTEGFYAKKEIRYKGTVDLVTQYDVAVEKKIVELLKESYPTHEIVGEESWKGSVLPKKGIYVDPIDGTTNFVHSIPFCAVSIGIWEDGEAVEGVVYNPILHELFYAKKRCGAFLNNEPIHVSDESNLQQSLIATGFPYTKADGGDDLTWVVETMHSVLPKTRDVRRFGSASLDLCYTARGVFQGYYEINLKPWDTAAGVLIVQEAGGTVSTTHNAPYTLTDKCIIATNGAIHSSLSALLP